MADSCGVYNLTALPREPAHFVLLPNAVDYAHSHYAGESAGGGNLMAKVVRRETRTRSPLGKIIKWVFILFNLLMAFLLLKTCSAVGNVAAIQGNSAEASGAAAAGAGLAGAAIGGSIMIFWALGTIILGALTAFTRGPSIVTEERVEE